MKGIMEATALVRNVKRDMRAVADPRQNVVQERMRPRALLLVQPVERGRTLGKERLRVVLVRRERFQQRVQVVVRRVKRELIPRTIRPVHRVLLGRLVRVV